MQAKHLVMAFVSSLLADEQGFNVGNNEQRGAPVRPGPKI